MSQLSFNEGVKYNELSEAEKKEYEEKFGDPTAGEAPEEIGGSNVNKWLFNTDTVDKVLAYLFEVGIQVKGGDVLGKTIIFARNHDHAVFIEQRFNKNYPEYGGDFLRVIDNYESKAQDILERFTDVVNDQYPQIAVKCRHDGHWCRCTQGVESSILQTYTQLCKVLANDR